MIAGDDYKGRILGPIMWDELEEDFGVPKNEMAQCGDQSPRCEKR